MRDAYSNLAPGDASYDPDFSPPGAPEVPARCAASADCENCFQEAQRKLNFMRYNLEKLKIIYRSTKDYADNAMAFGDSASGIHGVSGLAWQHEKVGIQKSLEKLGKTYDEKYRGMMRSLLGALRRSLAARGNTSMNLTGTIATASCSTPSWRNATAGRCVERKPRIPQGSRRSGAVWKSVAHSISALRVPGALRASATLVIFVMGGFVVEAAWGAEARHVWGSFTTTFDHTATDDRARNIRLAAKRLDGRVVPPGRCFSFNEAAGNGYGTASTLVDGKRFDAEGAVSARSRRRFTTLSYSRGSGS